MATLYFHLHSFKQFKFGMVEMTLTRHHLDTIAISLAERRTSVNSTFLWCFLHVLLPMTQMFITE